MPNVQRVPRPFPIIRGRFTNDTRPSNPTSDLQNDESTYMCVDDTMSCNAFSVYRFESMHTHTCVLVLFFSFVTLAWNHNTSLVGALPRTSQELTSQHLGFHVSAFNLSR